MSLIISKGLLVMRVLLLSLCLLLSRVVASQPAAALTYEDKGLLKAARKCDVELTRSLLKEGANPNKLPDLYDWTALMSAVFQDDRNDRDDQSACITEVQVLLEASGDPNLENSHGQSAVSLAANWDVTPEIMDLLLAHNGNPDIQMHIKRPKGEKITPAMARMMSEVEGETPLMIMAENSSLELQLSSEQYRFHDRAVHKLQALLKKANINLQRNDGRSALMVAVVYDHPFIVRSLLAAGANPALKDRKGQTPLDYAIQHGPKEMIEVLSH
jgi:ankyrin repeat protein